MIGIGIRKNHTDDVLHNRFDLPVSEVIIENYVDRGGRMRSILDAAAAQSNLCLHGVSMSLGSVDEPSAAALRNLRTLVDRYNPAVVSDHLCFGSVDGIHGHDLWPMPFTEEAVRRVAHNVRIAQDALGRRIAIENISTYVRFACDQMDEATFTNAVCREAGCGLLLDVNNLVVNSINHQFDAQQMMNAIDTDFVMQVHLSGHRAILGPGTGGDDLVLDDHGSAPSLAVVELFAEHRHRFASAPVIIEWDEDPPDLDVMRKLVSTIEKRTSLSSLQAAA
jgi:uncharacterized protein